MKLLVTGASGLLGTRICQLASKQNCSVYSAYSQHIPRSGKPTKLDVTDGVEVKRVFEKLQPDAVVHSAALSDVDKCEKEKELAWKVNTDATSDIAERCHARDCFLVYVSTDYVFSGEKGNYKETDPTHPVNYYGLTKLEGEQRVIGSNAEHCITRTSVIYGADAAAGKTNFALWLIDKLKKKEEVKTAIDLWNSPTLNTSLAEMILEIVERRLTGTFHLAGATRLSRFQFAQDIAETFDLDKSCLRPTPSNQMEWLAERPRDTSLDVGKARQVLRSKPLQIGEALSRFKIEMS